MSFNTTSYLAGVGTVVAAIAIGFSSSFFLAPPVEYVEQNRLQRVTSGAPTSIAATQDAMTPKPDITPVRSIELVAAKAPAPSTHPAGDDTVPAVSKAIEPVLAAAGQSAAKPEANAGQLRAAEAQPERKRARDQRSAERRKQREIALATVAVKRTVRDRNPQQVADFTDSPRFGFFGEN